MVWEDLYHATAVETGAPLARGVGYGDLNMGRTGVVRQPATWEVGGDHDIQQERARLRLVDRAALAQALGVEVTDLAAAHRTWVETAVRAGRGSRAPRWTESVVVGSRGFVEQVHRDLGGTGRHRAIEPDGEGYRLREEEDSSGGHSAGKMTSAR